MEKRLRHSEEAAMKAYPVEIVGYTVECRIGATPEPQDWNEEKRRCYKEGYEQAEKDISALIESIIEGILGDAQPKPILRAELQELKERIKEGTK